MKRRCFTNVIASLTMNTLLFKSAGAVDFFVGRQRTRTKCYLPKHDYDHDAWPYTTPRAFGATEIAVAATNPTNIGEVRKPFHFRATALTVDHITLDEVGLVLYKDGTLVATGRIENNGGDGGLIGNNCVIRLRAYVSYNSTPSPDLGKAFVPVVEEEPVVEELPVPNVPVGGVSNGGVTIGGKLKQMAVVEEDTTDLEVRKRATPNEVTRIPPDAYVVWRSEHKLWVSRGRPHHIRLAPSADKRVNREALTRYFDEITHIEVDVEYRRDR